MRHLVCALAVLATSGVGVAQPLISPRGVVNAASFAPPGLPAGSIARGSIFSIFGQRLGPAASPSLAFPLSNTLGGVSIQAIGSTTVNVIPLFVSPTQINAIMPSNAPLGMVSVQVAFNNIKGNMAPVRVVNSSFGAFAVRAGIGPGIVQNFIANDNQPINSPANVSAKPGQAVTLWGTGLGPVPFADNVAPTAGNVATQTEVFVGGKTATLLYNGRTPCCAGVDQIVFNVPSDAPSGCHVPVTVRTEGATSSNTVTMAISSDGSQCADPTNPLAARIVSGGKFGAVVLMRTNSHQDLGLKTTADITVDSAIVSLRQENAVTFPFNPLFSYPPPGSCTAYSVSGNLFGSDALPLAATTGKYLDAGSAMYQLIGPGGSRQVRPATPPLNPILSLWQLGKNIPNVGLVNSSFLQPGTHTLIVNGGADIGNFRATIEYPAGLTWTNRDQVANITRAQPLTINWSGGPSNVPVAILGANVDVPTNSTALFFCVAPAGTTSFSVPTYILASVPATRTPAILSQGALYVGAMTLAAPTNFTATGLDLGVTAGTTFTSRPVYFK